MKPGRAETGVRFEFAGKEKNAGQMHHSLGGERPSTCRRVLSGFLCALSRLSAVKEGGSTLLRSVVSACHSPDINHALQRRQVGQHGQNPQCPGHLVQDQPGGDDQEPLKAREQSHPAL